MSAGPFILSRYERTNGDIHPIRVQPETVNLEFNSVANDPPAQAPSSNIRASAAGSKRSNRLIARRVNVRFTGILPPGYQAGTVISLPWLSRDTFTPLTDSSTGVYLGQPVILVSKSGESPV